MKKLRTFCTVLVMVIFTINIVISQNNFANQHYLDPYNPEYVKGELLVKFKDDVEISFDYKSNRLISGYLSIDQFIEEQKVDYIEKVFKTAEKQRNVNTYIDHTGREKLVPQLFNIYLIKYQEDVDAKELSETFQDDPLVEYAEPNYLFYTMGIMDTIPNDPLFPNQWYLNAIKAPAAWDSITGDTSLAIAIIDTGVDWDHPDLDDNIWINWDEIPENGIDDDGNGFVDDIRGWDFKNNDNNPDDDNSHGTHVAGIAAAEGNNDIGICGVSWFSKILIIKVLDANGVGFTSTVALGVLYASNQGSKIINLSLGSYAYSQTLADAINIAKSNNDLVIAAAGNDYFSVDPPVNQYEEYHPHFPAAFNNVIGVQATKNNYNSWNGWLASFSNYDHSGYFNPGDNYEIKAPGISIYSTKPGGVYGNLSGTSMAAPIVSGAASLLLSLFPNESTDEIVLRLVYGQDSTLNILASMDMDYLLHNQGVYYLQMENHTLIDTAGDNDGKPDAGEECNIQLLVRNVGGNVDSVWAKLEFGNPNDSIYSEILIDSSWIGALSPLAYMNTQSPFAIKINDTTTQGTEIQYIVKLYNKDVLSETNTISYIVEHGYELTGIVDSTIYLTPDKFWIINSPFKLQGSNAQMIIQPGTKVLLNTTLTKKSGAKCYLRGSQDSLIIVDGPIRPDEVEWSIVNTSWQMDQGPSLIKNSIINGDIFNYIHMQGYYGTVENSEIFGKLTVKYSSNNIVHGECNSRNVDSTFAESCIFAGSGDYNTFLGGEGPSGNYNNYINCNTSYSDVGSSSNIILGSIVSGGGTHTYFPNLFWGTNDENKIQDIITDFYDNQNLSILHPEPFDTIPDSLAFGILWKIEINEIDIQDEIIDPLGYGTYKFELYFNRSMDTTYKPVLSFGITSPYKQNIISDSTKWSNDCKRWFGYETIDYRISNGINSFYLESDLYDDSGFKCGIDVTRFSFIIQATNSASINFIAIPGIGVVHLEWPPTESELTLGYNLYRSIKINDSTFSTPNKLNDNLLTDTLYVDTNVIPDTIYSYYYLTVNTNMQESDPSKIIYATPLSAANGDANGDLSVNVLDITTIVAYMLNQNPSPFLFDAADVNYDGQINVLDIIGLVQLISGDKSAPLTAFVDISDQKAFYEINDNKLLLESEGNVAAMQFKFKIQGLKTKVKSVKILNELKIFSMAKGFEFAYGVVDDHIIGILFSFTGKEIPAGDQELFRFEGIDINEIEVSEIFGGDLNGNYVPVLQKGQQVNLQTPDDYDLKVQPNPFTQSTVISWQLAEEAMVDISIYNLKGEKIKQIKNTYQPAGIYQQTWNATDNNGKKLTAGVYICHFEAKTENQKITKDVKIILMK